MDSRTIRFLVLSVLIGVQTMVAAPVGATERLEFLQVNKHQLKHFNHIAGKLKAGQFRTPYYGAVVVMPFTNLVKNDSPNNESLRWALLSSMSSDLSYLPTMSPWPLWMIFEELKFECRELQTSCIESAVPNDLIERVQSSYTLTRGESLNLDYSIEPFLLTKLSNTFISGDYQVDGDNVVLRIRISQKDPRGKIVKIHEWSVDTTRNFVLEALSVSLVRELENLGVDMSNKTTAYIQASKSTNANAIALFGRGIFEDLSGSHTALDSDERTSALNSLLDAVESDDNFAEAWLALAKVMRSTFSESQYQWALNSAVERKPHLENLVGHTRRKSNRGASFGEFPENSDQWLISLRDLSSRSVTESRLVRSTLQALYLSLHIKDIEEGERLSITIIQNLAAYYAKNKRWKNSANWSQVGLTQLDAAQNGVEELWKTSARTMFLLFITREEIIRMQEDEPEISQFINAATKLVNFPLSNEYDRWERIRIMDSLYDYTRSGLGNYRLRNIYIPLFEAFRNSLAHEEFIAKDSVIRAYNWLKYLDVILARMYTDADRFDDAIRSYDNYIQSGYRPKTHTELIDASVLMSQANLKNSMGYSGDALITAERAISIVKEQAQKIDDPDKATREDIDFMTDISQSYIDFFDSRGNLLEAETARNSLEKLLGVNFRLRWSGKAFRK